MRILDALGRGLLKEFPNPERAGCPSSDVLKRIASHEMPLSEAEKWLDHLTSCSPCYGDFSQFQAAYQSRRTRSLIAIAASILIVACLAGWALFLRHSESLVAQTEVVDLRNLSLPRGTEPNPAQPPLEVSRAASQWNIYLPVGSSEGIYEVRLVTALAEQLDSTTGTAKLSNNITSLPILVNISAKRGTKCVLLIRKSGDSEWTSYPLVVR